MKNLARSFGVTHHGLWRRFFSLLLLSAGLLLLTTHAWAYQVKRVLSGTYAMATTVEVGAVDLSTVFPTNWVDLNSDKTLILVSASVTAGSTPQYDSRENTEFYATLSDPKTLVFSRRNTNSSVALSVTYTVIEFGSGVNVYSGITPIAETAGQQAQTKTIVLPPTNVANGKAFAVYSVKPYYAGANNNQRENSDYYNMFGVTLNNGGGTGPLRMTLSRTANTSYNEDVSYQVVVFDNSETDVNVQSGTAIINGTTEAGETSDIGTTMVATIPVALQDPSKTLLFYSLQPNNTTVGNEDNYCVDGQITSTTGITFNRYANVGAVTIPWFAVEFKNNVFVQRDRTTINGTTYPTSYTINLNANTFYSGMSMANMMNNAQISPASAYIGANSATYQWCNVKWNCTFTPPTGLYNTALTMARMNASEFKDANVSWEACQFPLLNMVYPNGNELLHVGDTVNVQWEHAMCLETGGTAPDSSVAVNLLLSGNGGTTFPMTIVSGISSKNDSYSWTIPSTLNATNVIGTTQRVRVQCSEVYTNASFNHDESNADFSIKGAMTMTAPVGGETWYVGDNNRQITWTTKGDLSYTTFAIDLSTNSGGAYGTAITSGLTQGANCTTSDGGSSYSCSYTWNDAATHGVTDSIGDFRRIKVSIASDPTAVFTASPADFVIKGGLVLTAPVGGETWLTQLVNNDGNGITWTANGTMDQVSLYYSLNSGADNYPYLIAGPIANTGSYPWAPPTAAIGNSVRVKVISNQAANVQVSSASAGDLSIVPSIAVTPSDYNGATLTAGVQAVSFLKYTVNGNLGSNVSAWCNPNGGTTWYYIGSGSGSSGAQSINWTPGDVPGHTPNPDYTTAIGGNSVQVMFTKYNAGDENGATILSSGLRNPYIQSPSFTVKASIALTSPTGGENWQSGTTHSVSWTNTGVPLGANNGKILIKFSKDNAAFNTIATVPVTDGSYSWALVDADMTSNGKVSIEFMDDSTVKQTSASFTIGTIALTHPTGASGDPLGGDVWTVGGQSDVIQWTYQKFAGNVNLYYSTDGGNTFNPSPIAANVPIGNLSTPWNPIPDIVGNNLKVKVQLASTDAVPVLAVSPYPFAVKPAFAITTTAPFVVDVTPNPSIQWGITGTYNGQVDIYYAPDGTNYQAQPLAQGVSALAGAYSLWKIPDNIGNTNRIKVQTVSGAMVPASGESTQFVIKGGIQVTSPTTGTIWHKGENQSITWTASGSISSVNISYKIGAGGAWQAIVNGDAGHGSGNNSYLWSNIPDINSNACYIQVQDARVAYADVVGESNAFSIVPSITVTAPAVGVSLVVDSSYPAAIQWSLNGSTQISNNQVNLLYSTNGVVGPFDKTIANGVTASTGSYDWNNIPDTVGTTVCVQVVDSQKSYAYGLSPVFNILGSIAVQQPAAGVDWAVGATDKSITWTKHGTIGPVNIYADYGLGSGYELIKQNQDSTTGTWLWPSVPDKVSNSVKVKITQANLESQTYAESGVFHIIGSFTITQPVVLLSEDPYSIQWNTTGSGVTKVKLEFYDGSAWSTISNSYDNNAGANSYPWAVPSTTSSPNCKLRVTAATPSQPATAKETNVFWIHGAINISSPTSTAKWVIGTQHTVTFTVTGTVQYVDVLYSNNGGSTYPITIASNIAASTGVNNVSWTLPTADPNILSFDQARIKIQDHSYTTVYGTSPAFMVQGIIAVTAPAADAILTYGGPSQNITWDYTGPIQNVRIYYSSDGGVSYNELTNPATGVPVTPSTFAFAVPNAIVGKQVLVKVADMANVQTFGVSGAFEIVGKLAITSPAGGEKWALGSQQSIKWIPTGTFTNVHIQASTDNFATTLLDVTRPAGSSGVEQTYTWTLSSLGNGIKVRVTDPDHHPELVTATSNTFTILGSLSVTAPKDGVVWYKGDSKQITWSSNGGVSNVKIEYKTSLAGSYTTIAANDPGHADGPNSYAWTSVADENSEACYVRVSDVNNYNDCYSTSPTPFSMRPVITVSQPLAGTNIRVGSSYPAAIKWSLNGSTKVNNVNILYSTNGANGPFGNTITTNVDPTLGQADWNVVSDTISNNVAVKVADSVNSNTSGVSPVFNIIGNISIGQPAAGVDWAVGATDKNITWTKQGTLGALNVYADYGAGYQSIATGVDSTVGSWNWPSIPDQISNTVKVKLTQASNETNVYSESGVFHIVGGFAFSKPDGAPLTSGSTYDIKWTTTGAAINNVLLEFFDGTGWTNIAANAPSSASGTYSWTVPSTIASPNCKVRITASNPSQPATVKESSAFWIHGAITVSTPDGNAKWLVGTAHDIVFNVTGYVPKVNILYSKDGGSTYAGANTIVTNLDASAGQNTYNWTIPTDKDNLSATLARIKVADAANATVFGESANFMVKGSIAVTAPAADAVLTYGGSAQNVTWTYTGPIQNVRVFYSSNNGATYNEFTNPATGVPVTPSTFAFNVPNAIVGKQVKVRVEDKDNSQAYGESGVFEIVGSLAITAPSGGEKWSLGSTQNIKWVPTGTFTNVHIQASADNFSTMLLDVTRPAGATGVEQTYAWTLSSLGNGIKIRVSDPDHHPELTQVTSNAFKILGYLSVTAPKDGVVWYKGDQKQITWDSNGSVAHVKIEYKTSIAGSYTTIVADDGGHTDGANNYVWNSVGDENSETCYVRVSDFYNYDDCYSVSPTAFSMRPKITVSEPLSGTTIRVSSSYPSAVKWNLNGSVKVNNVNILYSTNGINGPFDKTIITNVNPTDGQADWNVVSDTISNNVVVKVMDSLNTNTFGYSPVFNIIGQVTVTQPNTNLNWAIGSDQTITWTKQGTIGAINIYCDWGSGYQQIFAGVDSAAGSKSWTIPDHVTNAAKIKITAASDETNVWDESNTTFRIAGSFGVTAPANSAILTVNGSTNIVWTCTGTAITTVNLFYSTDGGTSYTAIQSGVSNTGTFPWTIPDALTSTGKVKVVDPNNASAYAESAGLFKIQGSITVTSPTLGTESWNVGTTYAVTWTKQGTFPTVNVLYSNDGNSWTQVNVTAIDATLGTWDWTISDTTALTAGAAGLIRVVNTSDATVFGTSAHPFEVKGSVTLATPSAAGVSLNVSDSYAITWTKNGAVANVKLYYSTNGGIAGSGSYPSGNIIATVASTPASYIWTVPDLIGGNLRIKAQDAANSNVWDESDNAFAIKGKIALNQPVGGESFIVGETHQIKWTPTGTYSQVKMEYSTNGFSDETQTFPIATVAAGASGVQQSYDWSVPDRIGTHLKVRVSDASNAAVNAVCASEFTIKGSLTLTSPATGDIWNVGDAHNITWTRNGSIANVKLEYSTDGWATSYTIVDSTPATAAYPWTVSDAISATVSVRVSDAGNATVSSTSGNFTIKGTLHLTAPIGNEVWTVGGSQNITWSKTGSISTIKIEYSTNGFANESLTTVINASIDATGVPVNSYKYAWTVDDAISSTVKVRITNNADNTVKDVSPSAFKIHGDLHLTQPNGGDKWAVATTQSINWTRTGTIANAKLEYSTDGGLTYPNFIATVPAGGLTTGWTIPNSIGTQARVKISDASDATVYDMSDANFTIMGAFHVSQPDGSEVWVVGTQQDINWTTTGTVANVKLDYSTDSGATFSHSIVATTANNLTFRWTIPDAISNQVRVRVADAGNADAFDTSDGDFRIKGVLTLTAPNGNDVWPINSAKHITWTRTGSVADVKIEYSTNAFSNELQTYTIIASTPGAPLDYLWNQVADTPSSNCEVRITDVSDATVYDVSNAPFRITGSLTVTSPVGTEEWIVNSVHNITWTKFGAIANVKISYSTDGGTTWPVGKVIVASTGAALQTYSWTVPDDISSQCKVKIEDAGDSTVFGISPANFAIKGSVTLAVPNGGQTWIVGSNQDITWTKNGSFANVKIEYSTDNFATPVVIAASTDSTGTPAASYKYTWSVADAISTNVKVRISDATNASVNSVSANPFIIKGALHLTSPVGGETWFVGDSRNITWTRTGSIANVKIEYSKDGGAHYSDTVVASTPAGAGTYGWTVADAIGGDVRIRISDASDATVSDASPASFTIKGVLHLTAPTTSQNLVVDSSYNITWTRNGTIPTVKLEYSTNAFADELQTAVISNSTDATTGTFGWTVPDSIGNTVKVRISNTADATVKDISASAFSIVGSLTLTAPSGGEQWVVGSHHNITWSKHGSIANVKLEFSKNNGTSYDYTITNSVPAGGLSYDWTIPDQISPTVLVRISDASNVNVNSVSPAAFAIMGGFVIGHPNGSEVLTVGDPYTIDWTTNGTVSNVKLSYSMNGGVDNYPYTIIASTPNTNSYNWTVADAISITCKVRVSDAANANAHAESTNNFKIRGAVRVTSPTNGTESWSVGYSYPITWTRTGSVQNIDLYYSAAATHDDWIKINPAPIDASLGTWTWALPADTILTTHGLIRIIDPTDALVTSTSSNEFEVKGGLKVLTPSDPGVSVQVGNSYNITWEKYGNIPSIQIHFSTNGGIAGSGTYPDGQLITTVPASDLHSMWAVPDQIGTHLRIRIRQADNYNVWDESDNNFEIKGNLQMLQPNGAEVWFVGDTNQIQWRPSGTFTSQVKLEYSTNGFANETQTVFIATVAAGASGGTTSYNWTTPNAIGSNLKARVTDANNATVTAMSASPFYIKGKLRILTPDGSEVWVVGTAQNITWQTTGTIANVKLEYSTDNGATFPNTISASTDGASGTYAWTIPDAIGANLRVRISDAADATVNAVSAATFTIKGALRVTAPNGGEAWNIGSTKQVTWVRTGSIPLVKVEYSLDSGVTWTGTIAASTDGASGTVGWLIPDNPSSTVKVRVSATSDSSVFDISDANFKLIGALQLTSPVGSEQWGIGTHHNITWTRTGSIANAKLQLSTNSGTSYDTTIVASTPAGGLSYDWTIPDVPTTHARVMISDASDVTVFSTSPADFKIQGIFTISAPNGSEVLIVGSPVDITWNTVGSVTNVNLTYSTDGGSTYPNPVALAIANSGTKSWTVPDSISSQVRVRVADVNDDTAFDTSNGNFKIKGALSLTAPVGGETWIVGSPHAITWVRTGTVSLVKLDYSTDGGISYLGSVATNIDASLLTYAWTVPDAIGTQIRVRVMDTSDATVVSSSAGNFIIKGALHLTSPLGGEQWAVATPHAITWTRTGSIANVKLEYSRNSGGAFQVTIANSTDASAGSYTWSCPDEILTTLRVRVSDASDAGVSDISPADFAIKGALLIGYPNGGEIMYVGQNKNITWTRTGSIPAVKLEYSTNSGGVYDHVIIPSTDASTQSYAWSVPDAISTTLRLKVTDTANATVYDASKSDFTIKGVLTLSSPVGGETWIVGDIHTITWTPTGTIPTVKLEYSTDGGNSFPYTIIGSTAGGTGTYAWTVPDAIGSNLKVRVSDTRDSSVNAVSAATFNVKGEISITSPVGGEQWGVGQHHAVTWTKTGTFATVKIEYSTNGGTAYSTVNNSIDATGGTYDWVIPDTISNQVKVKVTNNSDAGVFSESPVNFKITGVLALTSPVGAERWTVATNHNITWTRSGSISNVKLEYSTNGGGAYTTIISSTAAGALSFTWSVADAVSKTCRVRISDASDSAVSSSSPADFTIQAGFTVTSPAGGEVWNVGSNQNITWSTVGSIGTVRLDYSTDGGNTFPNNITASTLDSGSFAWTMPDTISSQAKVKVSDYNDSQAFGVSASNFKIRGTLAVTYPVGGEALVVGNTYNITWTRVGTVSNLNLEYSTNGGSTYNPIASNVDASLGTRAWAVPDALSQTCRVRITDTTDPSVFASSAANFKIRGAFTLTYPNGGEVLSVGAVETVAWSMVGSVVNAKLDYSTNGGSTFPYTIVASTTAGSVDPTHGSYPWTIPDAISTQVRVRVSDTSDATVYDDSNANFKVRGVLSMTSPNGSEFWQVSDAHNISWTVAGTIANVKLEYSTDSGATFPYLISASTPAVTSYPVGSYAWTVPDSINTHARVRVTNLSDLTVSSASAANFEIAGKLVVAAPNGGEVWAVGSSQAVSWSRVGSIANVKIEYSHDGGANYGNIIVASTSAATGSYNWVIPDDITTTAKVRISDVAEPLVFANSANNFKIRGNLSLTAPVGGEVFLISSARNITWTRFGSIANAKLEYSIDGGLSYPYTIVGSVPAIDQTYSWTVPDNPTLQARVRVSDAGDPTVASASNSSFVIRGGFVITAPNGGESWAVGSSQNVTWTTYGSYANVKLWYSTDSGATYPNLITGNTPNSGLYTWTVPDAISTRCRIKISDLVDVNATAQSTGDFEVHGTLAVTAPNGGEQWGVGTSQNITWTRAGSIATVKLEYSTNAFADGSHTTLINNAVPGANLSYAWTIPDAIGSTLKVRITDGSNAAVFAVSASSFRIKGSLTMTSPTGGESWIVGTAHPVTWSTQGTVNNVKLEYSTDAAATWNLIIAAVVNSGTYSWTIPDAISSQCRVRVSDSTDSTASSMTANNFKIRGNLTITTPNGGEKWAVGTTQIIRWDKVGSISFVRLEYSNNNGTTFVPIAVQAPNAGSYAWVIPDAITTQALVRIYDYNDMTVTDTSDAVFKIQGSFTVTSPNGGESWNVASDHDITWTSNGSVPFVNLSYSKDSGTTWNSIITNNPNSGTFTWTVPIASVSTQARVQVADSTDATANDTSNADFRIRCLLTMTSPNGNEQWRVGRSYNITWTAVGQIANVKLEYSRDNFLTDFQTITASTPAGTPYAWTIPNTISNFVKVRVSDPNDYGARDDSDAVFRITGDVHVTSPNGGEKWEVQSVHPITWTTAGTISQVTIEYSLNGGATYPNIIAATDNTGSLSWTVPDAISPACKIMIADLADATANDISDANFKIMAKFTLTSPVGGEIWTVGDQHTITWTTIGTVANAKIDYSTDGGTTYPGAVAVSAPNTGTYAWTVPDAISTTVRIRVASAIDTDALAVSAANFKIRGAFVVTSPNGGEMWQINQLKQITWNTIGTIANVKLQYSTDSGATWPYTITNSVANTNSFNWTVPDTRTPSARVLVTNTADATVNAQSAGDFRIQGFLTLTSPVGGEAWIAGDIHNITWTWGGTLPTVKLVYSTDAGVTFPYTIAANAANGAGAGGNFTYAWTVPDTLSLTCRVKVQDPNDDTVNSATPANFKIRGQFHITSPVGAERWVTNESHNLTWTTRGSVANVKLEYSKDNFTTPIVIVESTPNANSYAWTIPDDRAASVKVRISDVNDATINDVSPAFKIDYYNISWTIRDLLTNEQLTNLSVNEKLTGTTTVGWQAVGLTSPVSHATPYGFWTTTWSASGYGDKGQNYTADSDQSFTIYLETTAVHIWAATAQFTWNPDSRTLSATSWLERDGSIVAGVSGVDIYIYNPDNLNQTIHRMNQEGSGAGGYFTLTWVDSGNVLQAGKVYPVLVDLRNASGAHFKTPTSFSITEAQRLASTEDAMNNLVNVTIPTFQNTMSQMITGTGMSGQELIDAGGMKGILDTKTTEMKNTIQSTMTSFETSTGEAIQRLQSGADTAVQAGQTLEATSKKYSWNGQAAPDPALTGDAVTISVQGQPRCMPLLSLYTWDNKAVVQSVIMTETRPGFYVYSFAADSRFTPGKAYTYMVTEQTTGGLVAGSAMVESMGITTVAGLAAAAPEAERAAKKALDAIKAVEAVLVSNDNINISMTLKNLKDSVDELPSVLNKEGPDAKILSSINDIGEKLKGLVGEQGVDIGTLLDEKLGGSSTIKEMRNKTDTIQSVVDMLLQILEAKMGGVDTPIVSTSLQSGSVKFRIMVVNPSKLKAQTVQIKKYLPEEVKPKDIMDLGGLELEYDSEKSIYYVYKNGVDLQPGQALAFEVEVEDIWTIQQSDLTAVKEQAQELLKKFEKTAYLAKAKEVIDPVPGMLDEMARNQADDSVSREQHIGYFRQGQQNLKVIKERLAELEKILQPEQGSKVPDILEKSKMKMNMPSKTTTWLIILVVITFLGLLAGIFFFVWQSQIKSSQGVIEEAKKAAFPGSKPEEPKK